MRGFDVAIAGGGPAGAAAAIVLARAGMRVLLADSGCERAFRIGENLPPSARSLLHELGVLDRVLADGHRPSHGTLAFWGEDAPHASDFLFQLHGHGLQLDRARFDGLLRLAAHDAGAEVVESARLHLDARTDAGAQPTQRLRLRPIDDDMREVETRWLIDASGRAATLARRLGALRRQHGRLLAFYLRMRSENGSDQDGRTCVEAVEDGWWYSVLLPGGERVAAFLSDADLVDSRALLDGNGVWVKLQQTRRLRELFAEQGYRPSGRARGADASSTELDHAAGDRWLAVGDAAGAFDPLSAKGISNALYTGLKGAQALIAHDGGDLEAPTRYAEHLHDIHRVHLGQLRSFYATQPRWAHMPFWERRRPGPGGKTTPPIEGRGRG
ncbi:NAD(P)/FAD-dependent oxidoreductase [Montanilutibacter psychrotolerans]|uniref:Oxidoreductase n=1 Tax=Montanilutibacter psychrotolerans TaxID=1327343 RepID=A0A3M8SPS9_9GAMM|nr:tryptophan 7-halogenase [Lysobacter psychrotolerans]RNF83311.1 oxidoreductase [Lysobacter psychrotolerans]